MSINIFPLLADSFLIIPAVFSLVYSFDKSLPQTTRRWLRLSSFVLALAILALTVWLLWHPLQVN
ncbi:hypothetical protein [Lactobacillus porci]|uniref:Uncharacterized protein n=1 Tax=Lactobacillus porci TaxID=2012477 RepID=A0A6A8MG73_9LACO|nr:hypothetical protein [Lactobacillus porci]MST87844.1 hypothetical protein [Lactobacillus porci]